MTEYHKIPGLYKRDEDTKRLIYGEYRTPAVRYLADSKWIFTEKIDGTNIRVNWDGHRVCFAGRTDKATIPAPLLARLGDLFGGEINEQIFEQHFGGKQVTLYGEGYGAKIQTGGDYRPDQSFILFDVSVGGVWLQHDDVECVAKYFGCEVVPVVFEGTIPEAVSYVKRRPASLIGTAKMEGLVGRPAIELKTSNGERVIVKIKVRDFDEMDRYAEVGKV